MLCNNEGTTLQMMTRHLFQDHQSRQTFDAVLATIDSINDRLEVLGSRDRLFCDGDVISLERTQ